MRPVHAIYGVVAVVHHVLVCPVSHCSYRFLREDVGILPSAISMIPRTSGRLFLKYDAKILKQYGLSDRDAEDIAQAIENIKAMPGTA